MRATPCWNRTSRHKDQIVGVIFACPNLSVVFPQSRSGLDLPALQQAIEQPESIAFNGFGVLPAFQLQGVNAWLFVEMEQTIRAAGIRHVEIFQVAETTARMRHDLAAMSIGSYKIRRVYRRHLEG